MVRWKVHRLWSESGGQSQHGAQTVRRVERRRDVADLGTRDCAVAGDWLVAGRPVFVPRRFNTNQGRRENWILPPFGESKPFQRAPVGGGSQYDGNFSPDGHWLAYFSDETGQPGSLRRSISGAGWKIPDSHGGG